MAITFPYPYQAWYSQANWLDGITSFTWAAWCRLDTMNTGVRQGLWGHTGSTNYLRVQKDTNDEWHCAVTCGGHQDQIWDTTGTVVAGTVYHLAVTWVYNTASTGLNIYRNGSLVASTGTTGQTVAYNSGGNVDLYLGGIANLNRLGYCSLEDFALWTNYFADAEQVAALYRLGWPHLAVPAQPAVYWPLHGALLTRMPDGSGNGRHIESTGIDTGITAGTLMGKYEDPWQDYGGTYRQSAAGPDPPNPWTFWATVTHPTVTSTVTGLTNGTTYEFSAIAVDTSDNESTRSATVEGTPAASGITYVHVPRRKWGGR